MERVTCFFFFFFPSSFEVCHNIRSARNCIATLIATITAFVSYLVLQAPVEQAPILSGWDRSEELRDNFTVTLSLFVMRRR